MKDILISVLRNKKSNITEFRDASQKLGLMLAIEAAQFLEKSRTKIETPFKETDGVIFKNKITLIPILRSGIALLEPFINFYNNAKVGFFGVRRDEKTAKPMTYYQNFPDINDSDDIIILDPTVATGGSLSAAINLLKEKGAKEDKIIFAGIIAAQYGFDVIKNNFPKIKIIVLQKDPKLSDTKFIIPGIGDFGDRYFGTE